MIPHDYEARVYAGWLGKCIGVRFGAPLENWTYEEIRDNLGELTFYLREDQGKIFKPDDDTSLPMILIRALEDYGISPDLTAQQIGQTWRNYLGDQHGTLWWGGYGVSTEHTAYLNLAAGIPAPRSGSIAQNGAALAEQIGGQIFSDIWGLIAPNNPALAAELSARSSSVSHDGAAIDGGRFIAALVSLAFSEPDPRRLIACGLDYVRPDGEYARVIRAMLDFHSRQPDNWRAAFAQLKANFGYDRYPGVVHIIPNAGVVALALLYGAGDFSQSIRIANMCGWDTDCNVGSVGAIMGVAVGLDGIDTRWREPMNDLLITASIIGTRNILTIPQCADLFSRIGRQLAGGQAPGRPRYHFGYAGSTSNFQARGVKGRPIDLRQADHDGTSALRMAIRKLVKKGEIRLFTRTYYRPQELSSNYYGATFSPLIYPGQTLRARLYLPADAPETLRAGLYAYDDNHREAQQGSAQALTPGAWHTLAYTLPPLRDACLSEVGIVLHNLGESWETGHVLLEWLDWDGGPDYETTFARERGESGGISQWTRLRGYWRLEDGAYHGSGPGECETYSGDLAWGDYTLEARLVPLIGEQHHINVRVQGALRSYAFGLAPGGRAALYRKEGQYREVAAVDFDWRHGEAYTLRLSAQGAALNASIQGGGQAQALAWTDTEGPYLNGQIGLSTWNGGHTRCEWLRVGE